jgi:hypothetical protein
VSDGSYTDGRGSAAVILEGDTCEGRASFSMTVPGDSGEMSANRAELAGLYAAIRFITKLCDYYNVSSGGVYFGCDGLSALQQSFSLFPPAIDTPSYDILSAIHNARILCPVEWTTRHIKGHQDDDLSYDHLDRWGQLNVEADALAKAVLSSGQGYVCRYLVPLEPWSVWFKGKKLSQLSKQIYYIIHYKTAKEYWTNKIKTIQEAIDYIHWDIVGQALKSLP